MVIQHGGVYREAPLMMLLKDLILRSCKQHNSSSQLYNLLSVSTSTVSAIGPFSPQCNTVDI